MTLRRLVPSLALLVAAPAAADTLYALDHSSTLTVIDTNDCSTIDQQAAGYRPSHLAYDATRDQVFIGEFDISGTVTVYDRTSRMRRLVGTFDGPIVGLAVHPSGSELYVLAPSFSRCGDFAAAVIELEMGR
jgi:DNA-binding beta-propeller fold protein YncE